MNRLILLDRDGVINHDSPDCIKSVGEFRPISGSIETIARLQQAGFKIGLCTNQSAVGRGLLTRSDLNAIHLHLKALLEGQGGGDLHAIACCPHLPDAGCKCRKPAPGMLLELMQQLGVPNSATVFVGDSLRDVEAGMAAGCRVVLVRTGNGTAAEAAARKAGVREVYDDLKAFGDAELARTPDADLHR